MPILLLICLVTACLPIEWPAAPLGSRVTGGLTSGLIYLLVVVGFAWRISRRTELRLIIHPEDRDLIGFRYGQKRLAHLFLTMIGFWVMIGFGGWGAAIQELCILPSSGAEGDFGLYLPGAELLIILPFFVALLWSWDFFFDVEQRFHAGSMDAHKVFWTRGGYLLFNLRQYLMMIGIPVALMVVQLGMSRVWPEMLNLLWVRALSLLTIPAMLILFPLLVPILLGLHSLPPGEDRDRLDALSRNLGVRCTDILLWDTHSGIANALVVGVLPRLRYVIFTDRILQEMTPPQIDAIFGHEAGHVKHGHVLFYGLFLLLSATLMGAVHETVRLSGLIDVEKNSELFMLSPVLFLGLYMLLVFGMISRRCERQADIFGCRAVSCAEPHCLGHTETTLIPLKGQGLCRTGIEIFISALERVERINGMNRDRTRWRGTSLTGKMLVLFRLMTGWIYTWQHSTITKRVAFLRQMTDNLSLERKFQNRVFLFKCSIIVGLIGLLVAIGATLGWEMLLTSL